MQLKPTVRRSGADEGQCQKSYSIHALQNKNKYMPILGTSFRFFKKEQEKQQILSFQKRDMKRHCCVSCGIMTAEQTKGSDVQYRNRNYQAAQRRSGRRLYVEGPASGVHPQQTGPPWQPDLLQNK